MSVGNAKYVYQTFRELNSLAETKLGLAATVSTALVLFVAKDVPNDPNSFDLYEVSVMSLGLAILLQVFSMLPFTDRVFVKSKRTFSGNTLYFKDVAASTLNSFRDQFGALEVASEKAMLNNICAQAHVHASIVNRKFGLFRISMAFFTAGIASAVLILLGINIKLG